MTESCVKSSRDQHQFWLELSSNGHHQRPAVGSRVRSESAMKQVLTRNSPEGCQVFSISHGGLEGTAEGDVDVKSNAPINAAVFRSARAREEVAVVMAMQGDVEHAGVRVEELLGRVAVVNVPVYDQNALQSQAIEKQLRGYGDRVEVTEAPAREGHDGQLLLSTD